MKRKVDLWAYKKDDDNSITIMIRSGVMLNILDPDPDKLLIEDIAHALSMQCRFAGHTKEFYSVAQHSLLCSIEAPAKLKLEALLHDASEAYIQDIARPLKNKLKEYKLIESTIMTAIAKKFGFNWPLSKKIKAIDDKILKIEFNNFILDREKTLKSMTPHTAKIAFLKQFYNLYKCKN